MNGQLLEGFYRMLLQKDPRALAIARASADRVAADTASPREAAVVQALQSLHVAHGRCGEDLPDPAFQDLMRLVMQARGNTEANMMVGARGGFGGGAGGGGRMMHGGGFGGGGMGMPRPGGVQNLMVPGGGMPGRMPAMMPHPGGGGHPGFHPGRGGRRFFGGGFGGFPFWGGYGYPYGAQLCPPSPTWTPYGCPPCPYPNYGYCW